jgi:riboflavin transporter FmnP
MIAKNYSRTVVIAGTALFGTLAFILDWALKLAGLKILFPLLPILRYDIDGIPIVLSLLFFGLPSGAATSAILLLAISFRDVVGASMKALAEFSTILGMAIAIRGKRHFSWMLAGILGAITRVAIMSAANLVVFPLIYKRTLEAAILLLPLLAIFNATQAVITLAGGYLSYKLIQRRIPGLMKD